jgi:hypothetical protein
MFPMTQNLTRFVAARRRPALEAEFRFIQARAPNIRAALTLAAERLFDLIDEHALIAGELPYLELTPERKTAISRAYYEEQPEVIRLLGEAMRRARAKLGPAPAPILGPPAPGPEAGPDPTSLFGGVPPEQMEGWAPLIDLYARLREEAEGGLNLAMDLNLEMDSYSWFIVRSVMEALVQRLEDPAVPEDEKEALRSGFKDLLRYQDLVLQAQSDRRAQTAQAEQAGAARLEEARKDELLMEVQYAVAHGQPVDADVLERAAQWWQERKARANTDGQADPPAAPQGGKNNGRQARR